MISKKEYKKYRNLKTESKRYQPWPCWHCNAFIARSEECYEIVATGASPNEEAWYLNFHKDCFRSLAGDRYMMDIE